MNIQSFKYLLVAFITTASLSFADITLETNFSGAEGYVSGSIDKSTQKANPYFKESAQSKGSLYFPAPQSPEFGILRRNPTSGRAKMVCTRGEGSGFAPKGSWSTSIKFTIEGLSNAATGAKNATMLGGVGFTNSNIEVDDLMFAGIQKNPQQTNSYQFYVFGKGGGGFTSTNISYFAIGDSTTDADDLTDIIKIDLTVTKSARPNEFNYLAVLSNKDKGIAVATLTGTLKMPKSYNSSLFAYVSSGAIVEEGNYDLFNLHAFSYKATESK